MKIDIYTVTTRLFLILTIPALSLTCLMNDVKMLLHFELNMNH